MAASCPNRHDTSRVEQLRTSAETRAATKRQTLWRICTVCTVLNLGNGDADGLAPSDSPAAADTSLLVAELAAENCFLCFPIS